MLMKTVLTATGVILSVAMVLALITLLLMVLMNLAFPLLPFNYWQALALLGVAFVIGLPGLLKD